MRLPVISQKNPEKIELIKSDCSTTVEGVMGENSWLMTWRLNPRRCPDKVFSLLIGKRPWASHPSIGPKNGRPDYECTVRHSPQREDGANDPVDFEKGIATKFLRDSEKSKRFPVRRSE